MNRAAAIQMVSSEVLADNLRAAEALLQQAAEQGARLAVLPENFAIFGAQAALDWLRTQISGRNAIEDWLSRQARELGLWIVGGSLPWLPAERPLVERFYSACPVFNAEGDCVARYRKMHLFDADVADAQGRYRESDRFLAGDEPVVVDTPLGRLGLAICYDLRFPELFRHLRDAEATIFCVPAAFTKTTGDAHWQVLLRARAIENQCFVIAANQGGQHSEHRETNGHSQILSPWGEVLAEHGNGPGVAVADLDLSLLQAVRQRMPVQQHRRRDCFPDQP